jgi:hypothetical protein
VSETSPTSAPITESRYHAETVGSECLSGLPDVRFHRVAVAGSQEAFAAAAGCALLTVIQLPNAKPFCEQARKR